MQGSRWFEATATSKRGSEASAASHISVSVRPSAASAKFVRVPRWMRTAVRWSLRGVLALWALLLTALLLLHWLILPHIDEWRPRIEQVATRNLGLPVRIGQIEVSSGGWIPALTLRDVRLLDKAGREALRLPHVAAALSARSLLTLELRFQQLLVDAPELEVRRDANGRISVAGLDVESAGPAETGDALLDWFFSQHEFVIRHGRVRWVDEQRGGTPLELGELDLLVQNGLRRHAVRLDATPPTAWGQRFTLRGRFTQSLLKRAGEISHWSGQLYAELPRADVSELRRHVNLPFELSEGDGALRAWLDLHEGEVSGLTLDLALRAVRLRLAEHIDALDLARIEGRVALRRDERGLAIAATQLGFEGDDGLVWPRSDWRLQLSEKADAPGGELGAEQLDLQLMAQIAERLPLAEPQRRLLSELAPQGRVRALQAQWQGELAALKSYRVKATLEDLSVVAKPAAEANVAGRPGLAGASLQLDASEKGGQAKLKFHGGAVELPGVFEQPRLDLPDASATLAWTLTPRPGALPMVELRVSDARIANADLRGHLDALWRTGAGAAERPGRGARFPGYLELNGRLDEAQAVAVARHLPLGVGRQARDYVRDAVRGGLARQVQFRVRGDLWDFPFDQSAQGQFRISTQAEDVQLAYVPSRPATATAPAWESPWPAMDKVNAELVFERAGMQIRNGRARVLGYELYGVNGGIKDLMHKQVLALEGSGRGPAAELLHFMRASPVGNWTGHALDLATASGNAALKLGVQIPLDDVDRSTVKGQVVLGGNDMRLRPDVPLLGNARARVDFDQRGVSIHGGSARVLGGEASFEGGSQRDGSLRFTGQGQLSAEALRRAGELGVPARLAQAMSGQTAYRLELGFAQGRSEMVLTSSLQGLALDLPAPLRKSADSTLPLRFQNTLLANGARDELRFELGNVVQARYLRELAGESPRVISGAIALQDSLPALPAQGVRLQANLDQLNLDAWQEQARRLFGESVDGGAGNGYAPGDIGLRARGLQVDGRTLDRVVAGVSRVGESWRATVDAEQLSGYIELLAARGGQPGLVFARLARLSLPKSEADRVSHLLEQQPASVPALDIVVEDFELRGKRLGRLEVEARSSGPQRDWRLAKLQLRHPDALLNASGRWQAEPGQRTRRTQLEWTLEVHDAGQLLEALGQGRVLRGGKGELAGTLGWQGSPLSPDYPSMGGKFKVAIDAGQFLKAEPGMGRLLGVLSLQSLPRRLLFDFRDVFNAGFAFDGFGGDVQIERGVASSQNLRMTGVQAAVLMAGSTDLAAETQDLRVLVVPEINAAGASLAYAAINPAVGLGTFLAQLVLRRPMIAANTREFHVTGSWDDPKVERVEHKGELPGQPASGSIPGELPGRPASVPTGPALPASAASSP